jgi:hypothetical protein
MQITIKQQPSSNWLYTVSIELLATMQQPAPLSLAPTRTKIRGYTNHKIQTLLVSFYQLIVLKLCYFFFQLSYI